MRIGAQDIAFKFDYAALKVAKAVWGDAENVTGFVHSAADRLDVDALAKLAEIASTPKLSAESIFAISPPVMPLALALATALRVAFMGPGLIVDEEEGTEKTSGPTPDPETGSGPPSAQP
jgi:hypothetical protein